MDALFSSEQFTLKPHPAAYFREELFISSSDARRLGIGDASQFGILAVESLHPGPPDDQFAVRLAVDSAQEPGVVCVNQNFLDSAGFRIDDERFWSFKRAPAVLPVTEAVIELVVEQGNVGREIETLRRERRDLFLNRCLLVDPQRPVTSLSIPIAGRGYFNFRSVRPSLETLQSNTLLVFNDNTALKLFVPHRKGGVDMVILVDGSGSMDLQDYVGADRRPRTRLEGVRAALETLLQRRLVAGSRVSRIAAVAFASNATMLYPPSPEMVELRNEAQVEEIRASTRNLSIIGLGRIGVERNGTDISAGMRYAAELLDYYYQEGNEKMIVLLSDGAHWKEDTESEGEIISTSQDPSILADSLHFDSQVRIHTVAISNEQSLKRHYPDPRYHIKGYIPDTTLLRKIADFTDGVFFESPDAQVLARLFDELGEGALYQL